jgi:thiamine biosynthesis lipoprotein
MRQSVAFMGTIVTIDIVDHAPDDDVDDRHAAMARAFDWFRDVEATCTRFDESSELMQLCRHHEVPTPVSEILFAATQTAIAVAEASDGAFDPVRGARGEGRGASFRDIALDADAKTITLGRPLQLDLNAVAKGLAVDLAARELVALKNFVVDAGGDLYASGRNAQGDAWRIGIRHPSIDREVIATIDVSGAAICTSGNYERRDVSAAPAHIVHPATGAFATDTLSATVVASSAMLADAMSTAAFVIGGTKAIAFLERNGVDGLLVTADLDVLASTNMSRHYGLIAGAPILPHA